MATFRPIPFNPDDRLLKVAYETQLTSYMWASCLIFLVCDTIATLEREVEFIWSSRWSIPKFLYFFMRYWSIFQALNAIAVYASFQSSLARCHVFIWFKFTVGGTSVLLLAINIILSMRLYALYGRSCKVLWITVLLIIGAGGAQIYGTYEMAKSAANSAFLAPPDSLILGCLTSSDNQLAIISWIVSPVHAGILFFMMAGKFCYSVLEARREGMHLGLTPIMRAFIRDGTLYFFLVLVTLCVGALDSLIARGAFANVYQPWNTAVFTVAGTRLILNLRVAAAQPVMLGDSTIFRGLETSVGFGTNRRID